MKQSARSFLQDRVGHPHNGFTTYSAGIVLVLCKYSTVVVLVVYRSCVGSVRVLYGYCSGRCSAVRGGVGWRLGVDVTRGSQDLSPSGCCRRIECAQPLEPLEMAMCARHAEHWAEITLLSHMLRTQSRAHTHTQSRAHAHSIGKGCCPSLRHRTGA